MLFGLVAATATFVIMYSRLETFSINKKKMSTALRTFEERQVLLSEQGKILTMRFRGYIFFGSAVNLINSVKKHIKLPDATIEDIEADLQDDGVINESSKLLSNTNIMHRYTKVIGFKIILLYYTLTYAVILSADGRR